MKKIIILLLAVFMCLFAVGCTSAGIEENSDQKIGGTTGAVTVEKTKYLYQIEYKTIVFASDEDKEAWREPLTALISNAGYYTPDSYVYPYPERPGVSKGISLGLLDINLDGVPELLVNEGGGSAGNAYFSVYDIQTGEFYGTMDGGHDESWCVYFNRESGELELIGQYMWREGWDERKQFIQGVGIDLTDPDAYDNIYEIPYFYAEYIMPDISEDGPYKASFSVGGNKATLDKYLSEYSRFVENYARIPNTGLSLVSWEYEAEAGALVDELLSSGQMFVLCDTSAT